MKVVDNICIGDPLCDTFYIEMGLLHSPGAVCVRNVYCEDCFFFKSLLGVKVNQNPFRSHNIGLFIGLIVLKISPQFITNAFENLRSLELHGQTRKSIPNRPRSQLFMLWVEKRIPSLQQYRRKLYMLVVR